MFPLQEMSFVFLHVLFVGCLLCHFYMVLHHIPSFLKTSLRLFPFFAHHANITFLLLSRSLLVSPLSSGLSCPFITQQVHSSLQTLLYLPSFKFSIFTNFLLWLYICLSITRKSVECYLYVCFQVDSLPLDNQLVDVLFPLKYHLSCSPFP